MTDLKNYGLPKEDKRSAADFICAVAVIVMFFVTLAMVN